MPEFSRDRRLLLAGLALACARPVSSQAQAQAKEAGGLRLGVVPYLPVRRLLSLYQPIADLAARVLAQPVRIFSAPDFERFIEEARRGEFDLVGVSGHIARILQREHGALPLARAAAALESVIVVPHDSPLRQLSELKGRRIAVSDRLALHVLIALRLLRNQGLNPGTDTTLVASGSQANALTRLELGEADAAIGSVVTIRQLKPELSARIRRLGEAPKALTALAYLLHPRWASHVQPLQAALLAFPSSPEGVALMATTQHEGIVPLTLTELATLDGDVTEYYRQRAAPA